MNFRRKISLVLSVAMLTSAFNGMTVMAADTIPTANQALTQASVLSITKAEGWFESAYVQWTKFDGAEGYNVYVKADGASVYTKLDEELVRKYDTYYRADALGLVPGSYNMKVVPIVNGVEVEASSAITTPLTVKAYVREGFAFSPHSDYTTTNGGYNSDGSIKADANILYLTNANKDTLTVKGNEALGVGIVNILATRSSNKDKTPLVIRVLGKVEMPTGVENYMMRFENTNNVTMEGVGEDATLHGWGLTLKRACNTEFRNFAIMWYGGGGDGDSLSLDTENKNSWIHNIDFFYGFGKDSDQAKGDGSVDLKARTDYVTIDNNHFWDSGKALVAGGVWEAKNPNAEGADINATYHHNWFDHSDSRHPRCVAGKVHVYNNYYDGVAKYGIGAAVQSSVFVENNYFRNVPRPMIIATQGSDVYISDGNYDTKGTLSGQTGGMIKEFGNVFVAPKRFVNQNTTPDAGQIDAYSVTSRAEQVPSTITAMSGGATYNNFDTAATMYTYNVEAAENVPASVMATAGRMNGGDFKWSFDNSVQDTNSDVIPELQNAIINYESKLVKIGGSTLDKEGTEVTTSSDVPIETTTDVIDDTTESTTTAPVVTGSITHNFSTQGNTSSFFTFTGDMSNSKGEITYNGLTLKDCLKVGSSTQIAFTAPANGKMTLVFNPVGGKVNIKINGQKTVGDTTTGLLTFDVVAGTDYLLTKQDTANLYYINLVLDGDEQSTTIPTTETTTENTTETTTETTTEPITEPTTEPITQEQSPVSAPKANVVNGNGLIVVASIDSVNYQEVGFILESNGKEVKRSTNTVYTSIKDSNFNLQNLGGNYMFGFTISDILDLNAEISVTAYAIDLSGKEIKSQKVIYSINGLSINKMAVVENEVTSPGAIDVNKNIDKGEEM